MSSSKTVSKTAAKAAGAKRRPAAEAAQPALKRGKAARKATKPAKGKAAAPSAHAAASDKAATGDAISNQMIATAAAIEQAIAASDLGSLPNESLQKLMAAAVKAYSAKREAGETFLPVSTAGRVTPTDIMLTSSQLLRAGNLQVFELGMWQSWTGN